jgi:hypothetical protein
MIKNDRGYRVVTHPDYPYSRRVVKYDSAYVSLVSKRVSQKTFHNNHVYRDVIYLRNHRQG